MLFVFLSCFWHISGYLHVFLTSENTTCFLRLRRRRRVPTTANYFSAENSDNDSSSFRKSFVFLFFRLHFTLFFRRIDMIFCINSRLLYIVRVQSTPFSVYGHVSSVYQPSLPSVRFEYLNITTRSLQLFYRFNFEKFDALFLRITSFDGFFFFIKTIKHRPHTYFFPRVDKNVCILTPNIII